MTSDFESFCDLLVTDLTGNVAALASAVTHKLAPWSPEELQPDGDRHLAVWPVAESAEQASAEAMEIYDLQKLYKVLIWENAITESSRQATDYPAAQAWFQLQNDVRARFTGANRMLGGNRIVEYAGVRFPERSRQVRAMEISVIAHDDFSVW